MPRFRVSYRDPRSGESVTEEKDFTDWLDPVTGHLVATAREVAEDWAYTIADKGASIIVEI